MALRTTAIALVVFFPVTLSPEYPNPILPEVENTYPLGQQWSTFGLPPLPLPADVICEQPRIHEVDPNINQLESHQFASSVSSDAWSSRRIEDSDRVSLHLNSNYFPSDKV